MQWTEEKIRETLTEACEVYAGMDRPEMALPALFNVMIDEEIHIWKHDPDYDPMFGFACAVDDFIVGLQDVRNKVEELDPNLQGKTV